MYYYYYYYTVLVVHDFKFMWYVVLCTSTMPTFKFEVVLTRSDHLWVHDVLHKNSVRAFIETHPTLLRRVTPVSHCLSGEWRPHGHRPGHLSLRRLTTSQTLPSTRNRERLDQRDISAAASDNRLSRE